MEYVLKETICPKCSGKIIVLSYKNLVDVGRCSVCLSDMILPPEPYDSFVKENCEPFLEEEPKILECSSKGNKLFSALYAKVTVNGVIDSIENHYQKSKVFLIDGSLKTYDNWKDAKGKCPIAFKVNDFYLPIQYGEQYYKLLWYKYLQKNKHLEAILLEYDDYKDSFKSKRAKVCQADVIRNYMQDANGDKYTEKLRGKNLYNQCKDLLDILYHKNPCIMVDGDIFDTYAHIIGHQTNAQGAMGKGIALEIKKAYSKAFNHYVYLCKNKPIEELMGECQIVDCSTKIIANLFGQERWGFNKNTVYTNYDAIEKALTSLCNYAKSNNLIVSIPYKMGCKNANGDWEEVLKRIKRAFKNYYVLIYKNY